MRQPTRGLHNTFFFFLPFFSSLLLTVGVRGFVQSVRGKTKCCSGIFLIMYDTDSQKINSRRIFARVRGSDGAIVKHHHHQNHHHKSKCSGVLLDIAKQYCSTTVLHGCKYLSEPKRPVYER